LAAGLHPGPLTALPRPLSWIFWGEGTGRGGKQKSREKEGEGRTRGRDGMGVRGGKEGEGEEGKGKERKRESISPILLSEPWTYVLVIVPAGRIFYFATKRGQEYTFGSVSVL